MNSGMYEGLMSQLMQLNQQLTEVRTLLRAMAGPAATQSEEAAAAATETAKAEPKKFKKAKGGG